MDDNGKIVACDAADKETRFSVWEMVFLEQSIVSGTRSSWCLINNSRLILDIKKCAWSDPGMKTNWQDRSAKIIKSEELQHSIDRF